MAAWSRCFSTITGSAESRQISRQAIHKTRHSRASVTVIEPEPFIFGFVGVMASIVRASSTPFSRSRGTGDERLRPAKCTRGLGRNRTQWIRAKAASFSARVAGTDIHSRRRRWAPWVIRSGVVALKGSQYCSSSSKDGAGAGEHGGTGVMHDVCIAASVRREGEREIAPEPERDA